MPSVSYMKGEDEQRVKTHITRDMVRGAMSPNVIANLEQTCCSACNVHLIFKLKHSN